MALSIANRFIYVERTCIEPRIGFTPVEPLGLVYHGKEVSHCDLAISAIVASLITGTFHTPS